jgi:signal transduction histidine kinase
VAGDGALTGQSPNRRFARAAGLEARAEISQQDVDRRRTQLWSLSVFVLLALSAAALFLAVGGDLLPDSFREGVINSYVIATLVGALALAFLIYAVEKEVNLRKLSHLLVDERQAIVEMEQLDRVKSDFVASVSHDLKTPLTTVLGAAKTLKKHDATLTREQRLQFVEMIERQGTKLLKLVEEVLETSRIESGTLKLRRERVDLRALGHQIISDLAASPLGTGRAIEWNGQPERPFAWGDPTALQQVMTNLVENALKYSESPARVALVVRELESEVVVQVTDQGQGIPGDRLDAIFDRFKQAGSTGDAAGFGLGLYIVKNLVDAQGGTVTVESTLGEGTVFTVRFPKRTAERAGD